jgi:anaerobic ribonucleoside-triphosphate reductase activating protein
VALSGSTIPWRVHAVLPRSLANGPGTRFTIWSQGCALACHGCFNPETHPDDDGRTRSAGELADEVIAELPHVDGVTLTGGEPLEQPAAVGAFCAEVKARTGLGIIILTGFTVGEIAADREKAAAATKADMVVAGRYNARRHLGAGLRGSANKAYWALTDRYGPEDFAEVPEIEVLIAADATVTVTGMHPLGRDIA